MMIRTLLAAAVACLLFVAPASAESCMTWEYGIKAAAEHSGRMDDRVAAVLLTEAETAATWAILFPGKPGPVRLGVMVAQSDPGMAFVAGFDAGGCLVGSGNMPFGPLLDAMVAADVQSAFGVIKPVEAEAPGEDA